MLTVEKRIISRNFTRAGAGRKIEYIVIHYFGSLGTAAAVANYFAGADRQASAHYCLDEGNIVYQCVERGIVARPADTFIRDAGTRTASGLKYARISSIRRPPGARRLGIGISPKRPSIIS